MSTGKGLSVPFLQAIAEAAAREGYRISEAKEERCNEEGIDRISDRGLTATGALVIRLVPSG